MKTENASLPLYLCFFAVWDALKCFTDRGVYTKNIKVFYTSWNLEIVCYYVTDRSISPLLSVLIKDVAGQRLKLYQPVMD